MVDVPIPTDPISAGFTFGSEFLQTVRSMVKDPNQQAQLLAAAQKEIIENAQKSDTAQLDIEKSEITAAHWYEKPHLALMWLCIFAVGFDTFVIPYLVWLCYFIFQIPIPTPPKLTSAEIDALLWSAFGLGSVNLGGKLANTWIKTP